MLHKDNHPPAALSTGAVRQKRPTQVATLLSEFTRLSVSTLHDTLTSKRHSKDFSHARADYLRSRVWIISLIFLLLMPMWVIVDILQLPQSVLDYTISGRLFMGISLVSILFLTRRIHTNVLLARLSVGVLLGLPAAFYALVLATMPPDTTHNMLGYSFIPYMLMAMLAVFPLTLIETVIAGCTMLVLQLYSQHVTGTWMTGAGLQEVWLLAALLSITLAANYFHLGLLLRLYREATHDPLTGLFNRGALIRNIDQLSYARPRPTMTLLIIDLDHFKRINDVHGHSVGDQVLRQFAKELRTNLRQEDIIARYGGEEFVVVLIGTNKNDAMGIAEEVREHAASMQIKNHDDDIVQFTVSIGVASLHPDDTLESTVRRADERLYKAKQISRNCVVG